MTWEWRAAFFPGAGIPPMRDVGLPKANHTGGLPWHYYAARNGSLWRARGGEGNPQQVSSPGDICRVAVAPDGALWCLNVRGEVYVMRQDFEFINVASPGFSPHNLPIDIDVGADGTAWLITSFGRMYIQRPDDTEPRHLGSFYRFTGVTGILPPPLSGPSLVGQPRCWAVTDLSGPTGSRDLCYCDGEWWSDQRSDRRIVDVLDLSTGPSALWMVKPDGTVWITVNLQNQTLSDAAETPNGAMLAQRVAADYADNAWCVGGEGGIWRWSDDDGTQSSVPTPPPDPVTPLPPAPYIVVSGSGGSFHVKGYNFNPGADVTLRAFMIFVDQTFTNQYGIVQADADGEINTPISVSCMPGQTVFVSANDGRVNPNDLTQRLWTEVRQVIC